MSLTIELTALIALFVAGSGAFWRFWGLIDKAKAEAALRAEAAHMLASTTKEELAQHKLHVAEKYVTKEGMTEQTDRIIRTITDVGNRVEGLGARLDRFYENQPNAPRTRRTPGN